MNADAGTAPGKERPERVYLFATCLIDLFSPESGLDVVEVLERAGVQVEVPAAQTCCGQPAYTTGFPEEARKVAAAQLELFPQPWPIVVPSGSCGGMLRLHWPRLFADDPVRLEQARAIAARTVEFTEFLLQLDPDFSAASRLPVSVALHTSCSARREMGTLQAGRTLLQRLPGVSVFEQAHEAECCGFGGTFAIKHADISEAMTRDKVEAIEAGACDTLVSADCGCLLNLNCMLAKRSSPLRGVHLASFLRQRLEQGR